MRPWWVCRGGGGGVGGEIYPTYVCVGVGHSAHRAKPGRRIRGTCIRGPYTKHAIHTLP